MGLEAEGERAHPFFMVFLSPTLGSKATHVGLHVETIILFPLMLHPLFESSQEKTSVKRWKPVHVARKTPFLLPALVWGVGKGAMATGPAG